MKRSKIFKNGQSQAIRLPKELQFEGSEVFAQRVGNGVLLLPVNNPWDLFKRSLNEFSDDFMKEREVPTYDTREEF